MARKNGIVEGEQGQGDTGFLILVLTMTRFTIKSISSSLVFHVMERKKEYLVAGVVPNSSPHLIPEKSDTTSTIYLCFTVSLCHYLPLCTIGIKG